VSALLVGLLALPYDLLDGQVEKKLKIFLGVSATSCMVVVVEAKAQQEPTNHHHHNMSDTNICPKRTLAVLGGRAATWRRLEKAGFTLGIKTIEKWVERGNIPSNRIAQIALCAKEDGRPVDLYSLIVGMTPAAAKANKTTNTK
jgi:hypothetical protein